MTKSAATALSGIETAPTDTLSVEACLNRALWRLIEAMSIAIAASFLMLGLRINIFSNVPLIGVIVAYVAVIFFYAVIRYDPLVVRVMTTVGQLFIVLFAGLLLTYAASAAALPYRDAEFYSIDNWLGFDRESYRTFIEHYPILSQLLDAAYLSIQPQTAAVPFILILAKQLPRLQRFILALGFTLIATAGIAVFGPAMDAYIYVDLAPLRQAAIPAGIYSHIVTLEALRAGAMSTIQLNNLEGLITFPSFHTANAILFAWALWRVPYVRIAGLVVNALMIASTPVTGQHYVIDLIAGAAVAVAAIALAQRVGFSSEVAVGPTESVSTEKHGHQTGEAKS